MSYDPTKYEEALKRYHTPYLRRHLVMSLAWLKLMKGFDKFTIKGREIIFHEQVGFSAAAVMGSLNEGTYPEHGQNEYGEFKVSPAAMLAAAGVPNFDELKTKSDVAIWGKKMRAEMDSLNKVCKILIDHMTSHGQSDPLATISAFDDGSSPAVFTVDTARFLPRGMKFDVYRNSSKIASGIEVLAQTGRYTITGSTAASIQAGDKIYLANSYGNGCVGLRDIIDDQTSLFGRAATSDYNWQSTVIRNTDPTPVSRRLFRKMEHDIGERIGEENVRKLKNITTPDIVDAYNFLLMADRIYNGEGTWEGLWPKVNFHGKEIIGIYGLADGEQYSIYPEDMVLGSVFPGFMQIDSTGGTFKQMLKSGAYADGKVVLYHGYFTPGCAARYSHGKTTNLIGMYDESNPYGDNGGMSADAA